MLSHFSRVRLCVTPWTVAHEAPLFMGFSGQEYWSGLPFHSPAWAGGSFTTEPPGKPNMILYVDNPKDAT